MHRYGRRIMTRIRTDSIGLPTNASLESLTAARVSGSQSQPAASSPRSTPMESSIMDTADALASPGGCDMGVVESASPIHHHSTMSLLNGVTVTITSSNCSNNNNNNNNNIVTADEDDDKCSADKDGSDLRAIDFASEANHHSEPQSSVLDYDATVADDDNDRHGMMMVDSMAAAEIALSSSSSSSNSSSSSSSSTNSSNSSSGSSSSESASHQPEPEEVEAVEEEAEDEEEDDDEETHGEEEGDLHGVADVVAGVDESTSDKIMHTDDDPLLQETINALMNGTGGIEVVNAPNAPGGTVSTAMASAVAAVAAEMTNVRSTTNDELETDRNYECTYCGKLFTRSNTLSYHLKVHTGERPFKCKHCSKAFREQYRLMKHLKTHSKYRNRRVERGQEFERVSSGREHLHRRVASAALAHPSVSSKALVSGEEDCATGDSDRFFKNYDLPDGAAMKLEPDISLTEEGMSEVPDASVMLTEEVEVMDDGQLGVELDEVTCPPGVTLTDANDIRHQIIEERIKSLQREVHLVNQNLNRVESKVDGLTRIISLLIEKFEEDADQGTGNQHHHQAISQTVATEDGSLVPVTALTVVAQQPSPAVTPVPASPSSTMQSKALLIASTPTQQSQVHQQTVYTHVTTLAQAPQLQPTLVPLKESRTGNTHYYQFAEPTVGNGKALPSTTTTTATTTVPVKPSPSPTPPPPLPVQSTHQLTLTTASAGAAGLLNGNQLLDTFPEIPELPIRTVSDFLDLNDHCTDNEQFLLQMMIRLHQEIHNSQPFQRNIKRMMEALVTYEVLCQFSWSGKSAINGQYTKYVFGNSLGIIDLLTKTLNLGKSAEEAEANQKPIFAAIQSFIKHSRQNMIRDSRKRREPHRAEPGAATGMPPDAGVATISFHLNGSERFQTKVIKSEHQHHQQSEMVNPF